MSYRNFNYDMSIRHTKFTNCRKKGEKKMVEHLTIFDDQQPNLNSTIFSTSSSTLNKDKKLFTMKIHIAMLSIFRNIYKKAQQFHLPTKTDDAQGHECSHLLSDKNYTVYFEPSRTAFVFADT